VTTLLKFLIIAGCQVTIEQVYFIDMELADLSLDQYISYVFGDRPLPPGVNLGDTFDAVFSSKHCTELRTAFTIGSHIAKGIELIHQTGYVHRDLKLEKGMYVTSEHSSNFTPLLRPEKAVETCRL